MGYPVEPLLADRILYNLDLIEKLAPKWGSPNQDKPPYSDTQLLISLLGVLIFPHEKASDALGEIMRSYEPLKRVLNIVYSRHGPDRVEITDLDGDAIMVDPTSLSKLPTLLRNSIAHFNILPRNVDGRFAGIRVWNRDFDRKITFVADIDFDELRLLARHVLTVMRDQRSDLPIDDPNDPMIEVRAQQNDAAMPQVKTPRFNRDIWEKLVVAHGSDAKAAKITADRLLKREADRLRAVR
jgi:hypothetical protein